MIKSTLVRTVVRHCGLPHQQRKRTKRNIKQTGYTQW